MNRLARLRFLARLALLAEAVWPAFWPPFAVAGVFVCAALLDLPQRLPFWAHATLLAAAGLALLLLIGRGIRGLHWPGIGEADRRLEADSGLPHRPLAVLTDRPAHADPDSSALWQAHVARAMAVLVRLRLAGPRSDLARRDPRAFRHALVLALLACFAIAGADAPGRLGAALRPTWPLAPQPAAAELRAWITPPAYTGLAPSILSASQTAVSVPVGSHLTVGVTGTADTATLLVDGAQQAFQRLDPTSQQATHDLPASGRVVVQRGGGTMAAWDVTVAADMPPTVSWPSDPGRVTGTDETRLPWKVEDDYGVVSLQAELRLAERAEAPAAVITIPLPGGPSKSAKGASQQDLSAHVWAGLPVIATLIARDAAGQIGRSAEVTFELPGRAFQNPIAQILIAVRKGLSLHPVDRGDELAALDSLMLKPDAFGDDIGAWLNLSGIYYHLVRSHSGSVAEAQDRLWALALHMEEGRSEPTMRALEEARQAARDALDALLNDPSQDKRDALDARLRELQAAIDRHIEALTEEARRAGETALVDREGRPISREEMNRQTDRTRDAARAGRPTDAERQMAELERMLDKLRDSKPGQDDKGKAAQRQRGRQQMGAVQDMIAREGGLLDHTERRLDQNRRFGTPTQATDPNAEREADRRVQLALRRALGELMQQFGDLTGEIPPSLGEADQAMRDAGRQLNERSDRAASESVQAAIEALQKGAREMGQAVARKFGPPRPGQGDEPGEDDLFGMTNPGGQQQGRSGGPASRDPGRADSAGRDPLGRPRTGEGSGNESGEDVVVPEEQERAKSQAIQQELRRRGAERERPRPELDYIDRLLKQF